MSGDLIPRREALPEWMLERSTMGGLSRSVVAPMLAKEVFDVPSDCDATLVAFPRAAMARENFFAELCTDSDWTMFGGLALPPWARIVNIGDGKARLAPHERIAMFAPKGLTASTLSELLDAVDDRLAFLSLRVGEDASALADIVANRSRATGLRIDGLEERYEAPQVLECLQHIDGLDWLAIRFTDDFEWSRGPATILALCSLDALQHLELFLPSHNLEPLDALKNLRSLGLMTNASFEWHPQLPELRTLRASAWDADATLVLPDLCAKLERFYTDWGGSADDLFGVIERLPRLRHLTARIYKGDDDKHRLRTIDRLAQLVQLRTLRVVGRPYLDSSEGHLPRLETLTALESLEVKVVGATHDDVARLAAQLPSTSVRVDLFERVGPDFYEAGRSRSSIMYSAQQHAGHVRWTQEGDPNR